MCVSTYRSMFRDTAVTDNLYLVTLCSQHTQSTFLLFDEKKPVHLILRHWGHKHSLSVSRLMEEKVFSVVQIQTKKQEKNSAQHAKSN